MTDRPPPPPAEGGGAYPPPPGVGAPFASPAPRAALPTAAYTSWFTRVRAWLVDYIPILVVLGIGYALLMGTRETNCLVEVSQYDLGELCSTGASALGQVSMVLSLLMTAAYAIWNFGYRQGTTGSSIGKSVLKFRVVSESSRQPIGFGASIVRQLAHLIDTVICYIGYLVPLWDAKRQTIADKLMNTVCMPL